jgi:hypothetical protein
MQLEKKQEAIDRIYHLLCTGYSYLYETGKSKGHWDDIRGTALAAVAMDLKEQPNSTWLRLIRTWLEANQIKEGEVAGSWGEEIWDTAMCVLAMKSFEISSKDPIIRSSVEWIFSLYKLSKRDNWHDEPWETSWALIAILTAGTVPGQLKIEEPINWLLAFQDEKGEIIAPHYTAYFIMIWDKLKKTHLDPNLVEKFSQGRDMAVNFLVEQLKTPYEEILWGGEAWANGQILWALCATNGFPYEDEALLEKTITWFEVHQTKQGNWSDIEDTASTLIGLYHLLECLNSSEELFKGRNIKSSLQKRLPSPEVYIKRPFIERHKDTGGISINLNSNLIKIIAIIGASGAGLATILSLFDFFKKFLAQHVR